MKDRLIQLAHRIETSTIPEVSVTVGFDAVVDRLERPVRSVDNANNRLFFSTIGEFGQYLKEKDGLSCVIELQTVMEKAGGNMTNLAATLGKLGVSTDCVGTLGLPTPDPLFSNAFGPNCRLHSVGPFGKCIALEFQTGKVMLAQMGAAAELTYSQIAQYLDKSHMDQLFGKPRLLGLLNWSELYHSTDIWQNIFERHIRPDGVDFSRDILIDITDCSRSTPMQLQEYRHVTLSLNRNEAALLGNYLNLEYSNEDWKQLAAEINHYAKAYCTVIHLLAGSVAVSDGIAHYSDGFMVQTPVISTGGGDNYNAGLAFAMLLELEIDDAMLVANATSNYYVSNGHGPTKEQLVNHLCVLAKQGGKYA